MSGVYLSNSERLDLKAVLRLAESALTYPMLMPGDERTVKAIREVIDFLTTDDERSSVDAMRVRYAEICRMRADS